MRLIFVWSSLLRNADDQSIDKFFKLNEISQLPFAVLKNNKQFYFRHLPERYLKKTRQIDFTAY
jgi:hypothetical protein